MGQQAVDGIRLDPEGRRADSLRELFRKEAPQPTDVLLAAAQRREADSKHA